MYVRYLSGSNHAAGHFGLRIRATLGTDPVAGVAQLRFPPSKTLITITIV